MEFIEDSSKDPMPIWIHICMEIKDEIWLNILQRIRRVHFFKVSTKQFSADIKTRDGLAVEDAQSSDRPDEAVCTYKQRPKLSHLSIYMTAFSLF